MVSDCTFIIDTSSGYQAISHQHLGVYHRKGDGKAVRERHGIGLSICLYDRLLIEPCICKSPLSARYHILGLSM